uniref:Uncharacterized protein n=1 Tax=Rhizophagus irregularis (strain DAOM 181602 / DAOM 197198 / MUCL 43194) TaxID=747089 RepID=U9UPL8_RHIID
MTRHGILLLRHGCCDVRTVCIKANHRKIGHSFLLTCARLDSLVLWECNITEISMQAACDYGSNLRYIFFPCNANVTVESIRLVLIKCNGLEFIDFGAGFDVSGIDDEFRGKLPRLLFA